MTNKRSLFMGTCLLTLTSGAMAKQADKPNVIFIYADDMGKGLLSIYGQQYFQTPNIDRLVRGGVEFSNAYGGHYSAPARAMLLTGYSDCRADRFNIANGGQFVMPAADTAKIATIERSIDAERVLLEANDEYLPQIFKKAGYTTGQVGKLGYSFNSTRSEMDDQGWDYYYGYLDHVRCHGFYPPFMFECGQIDIIEGNTHTNCAKSVQPHDTPASEKKRLDMTGKVHYTQDIFNEKIISFLRENKDNPFFLYHPTQLPHGPISVPELHEQVKDIEGLTQGEKEYATMMILLDEAVGMILDEVERLGIADNTMFIFSADNGHEIYTQRSDNSVSKNRIQSTGGRTDNYNIKYRSILCGDVFDGNMGLAGLKRSNLEGGVTVPLVYYMPGRIEAGAVVSDIVANYDIIATMADMLGVSINKGKDAVSYYDLVKNPTKKHLPADRVIVLDSFEGPMIVRNDGWKVRYQPKTKQFELYNIFRDKREFREFTTEHPEILEELHNELDKWDETVMFPEQYTYQGN